MLKRAKLTGVAGLIILALAGISQAGAKIDGWVVDDFNGYASTAEMKASGWSTGGPWWILQELQAALGMLTIPPQTKLSMELVRDPNAFVAGSEIVDPNSAKAVKVHYELSVSMSCDLFRFTSTMGIPYGIIATGQPAPLDYLPVADFTRYDRLAFKYMNKPGNYTVNDDFVLSLVGPDTQAIDIYRAVGTNGKFLQYPVDTWVAVEFALNGNVKKGPSAFGRDMVSGITLGTQDAPGTKVTFIIDDIVLYNKSDPCPRYTPADLNLDCAVDLEDLALLAADWMAL